MDEFKQLLTRLTPRASANRRAIQYVIQFKGDRALLFNVFLEVLLRGSLNARARLLHLLEVASGVVGNYKAPPEWNNAMVQNLQKIVDAAVPVHLAPAALINLKPTQKMIARFYNKGIIDKVVYDRMEAQLRSKGASLEALVQFKRESNHYTSKDEVLRRMEDDRERAKVYKMELSVPKMGSKEEFLIMWNRIQTRDRILEEIRK